VDADTKICVSAHLFDIVHPRIAAILFSALGKRVHLCVVYAGTILSSALK